MEGPEIVLVFMGKHFKHRANVLGKLEERVCIRSEAGNRVSIHGEAGDRAGDRGEARNHASVRGEPDDRASARDETMNLAKIVLMSKQSPLQAKKESYSL